MISGRCSLLPPVRYVSELLKKRYCRDHDKVASLIVGVSPKCGLQFNRSDKSRPAVIFLSMRMASTSSGDPENREDPLLGDKNRLALEKSPYLLQHAHNPVQWYPWGQEAFEKARKEHKLIFLSIGYSTCHWCHVMERESFENPAIAEIMNQYFVNIKVDKEERPDIDRIYMFFIQSISGHGGWPMSVFLLPNLTPISGGTYFPPEDKYGQPGFKKVLLSIAEKWNTHRDDVLATGFVTLEILKSLLTEDASEGARDAQSLPSSEECGRVCVHQLTQAYEPNYGGFSTAPKFPHTANFNFLFHMYARNPKNYYNKQCLEMCVHTLTMIARGGIHDHVGQGFSRYSVDGEWHVPHFEKMLYDQAMLMQSYADAFVATKNPFFAEIVEDIATYVTRDLQHKDGGFYSAEDADSLPTEKATAKREGAFYVWTYDEVKSLLSKNIPDKEVKLFELFCHHFTVKPQGNVTRNKDPHNELTGKNVLIITGSLENTAEHFGLTVEATKTYLKDACKILFEERLKRPRPHLDDKIITAWNGLMITGLACATSATGDEKYVKHAVNTAKFIERYLYDNDEGVLLRCCYRDKSDNIVQTNVPTHGFHVDYAYVIKGLLDLYEATFDTHWIEFAEKLQNIQNDLFWDKERYGYYAMKEDDFVIVRFKEDYDRTEPSGNSVSCGNLLKLAAYLDHSEYLDMAGKLLGSFKGMSIMLPEMVVALLHYHDSTTQIYIVGELGSKDTQDLIRVVRGRLIPGKVLMLIDPQKPADILLRNEVVTKMKSLNGVATAYVCQHRSCSLPVTSPDELIVLLDEREQKAG